MPPEAGLTQRQLVVVHMQRDADRSFLAVCQEAFAARMFQLRGWKPAMCAAEWEALDVATPAASRDMKGPPYSPLRLPIPNWMLAEDFKEDSFVEFEEKFLDRTKKVAANKEEQCLSEMHRGLGDIQAPDLVAAKIALPPSALTAPSSATTVQQSRRPKPLMNS